MWRPVTSPVYVDVRFWQPVPTHINLLRSRLSYNWLGITHTVRSQILLLGSIGLSYLIGVCPGVCLLYTGILNLGGGGGGGGGDSPMMKIQLVKSSITKNYELFTSHYHMSPKYLVSPFTIFKNGPLTMQLPGNKISVHHVFKNSQFTFIQACMHVKQNIHQSPK